MKKGAIGVSIMDFVAYLAYAGFLIFFIFSMKACSSTEINNSITSSQLDISDEITSYAFLQTPTTVYDQKTTIGHSVAWSYQLNDNSQLEKILTDHYTETKLYPFSIIRKKNIRLEFWDTKNECKGFNHRIPTILPAEPPIPLISCLTPDK